MRALAPLVLALLTLPAIASPVQAYHQAPDGITARITPQNALGEAVVFSSFDGSVAVAVEVWRDTGSGWGRAVLGNTLRGCWFDAAAAGEVCPLSIRFTSSATGAVVVQVPPGAVPRNTPIDLFVTFSGLGGDTVPTSHHNVAKNVAIASGHFDLAEQLDFHLPTRIVVL
jgi:hypothetical protein